MRRTVGYLLTALLATWMAAPAVAAEGTASAGGAETVAITKDLVGAAEKDGELTLQYSSPLLTMQGMVAAFNKAYPKVHVNLERKSGSGGAYVLLQELSAGVNRVDIIEESDWAANQALVDKGAFAALKPENLADISKQSYRLEPYVYSPGFNRTVVSYNPKFVTPEQAEKLKKWDGILDPEFKGKISLVEPTFGVTLGPLMYVMETPGMGEDFLRKLKQQQPFIYTNTAQARDAVVSGQKPISWGAQWEAVILSDVEKGVPVRFVYPDPTAEWSGVGWGVLKNAPHPNAARLFFAWVFSHDGGLAQQLPTGNVRSSLTNLPDTRTSIKKAEDQGWFVAAKNIWDVPLADWVSKAPQYQKIWTQIMKRGG
jgi:ABC-type Fe3+ transport system substrate-binding protein